MCSKIGVCWVWICGALDGMFSSSPWYPKKRPIGYQECFPPSIFILEDIIYVLFVCVSCPRGPQRVLGPYSSLNPLKQHKFKIYSFLPSLTPPSQYPFRHMGVGRVIRYDTPIYRVPCVPHYIPPFQVPNHP